MKVRRLGNSGLKVSVVGLGCNNFGMRIDAAQTRAVVDAALDAGVTLFDTADIYGGAKSEEFLGKALGKRRHEIVLATKFGMQIGQDPKKRGGSRKWIMTAVEDSLRRLGTDYIDLYQHHQPDPDTPVDETLRALDDLVTQGKVRYLGCSNYTGWQIADADWTAAGQSRFVSAQNLYSLLELAFAWLLGHEAVSSVIAGATTPEQVNTNAATASWSLTPDEVDEVGKLVV
jgi:aryl-alcohol dehydrogenase-like predicted oxidoreductase